MIECNLVLKRVSSHTSLPLWMISYFSINKPNICILSIFNKPLKKSFLFYIYMQLLLLGGQWVKQYSKEQFENELISKAPP